MYVLNTGCTKSFETFQRNLFYFKKKQINKTMRHQFETYNRLLSQLSIIIENQFNIIIFDRTYLTKKNDQSRSTHN